MQSPMAPPDPLEGLVENADRSALATAPRGLAPSTLLQSFADWWVHLSFSPGKQMQLRVKGGRPAMLLADYAVRGLHDAEAALAINISPTLDAAALCKMADRGQISGATLDGPLAFDNGVSSAAARAAAAPAPDLNTGI